MKMTDTERHAAAKTAARRHIREMDELLALPHSATEREELSQEHYHEIEEILGDMNQSCIGTCDGPTA